MRGLLLVWHSDREEALTMFEATPAYGVKMFDVETRCLAPVEELNPDTEQLDCVGASGWCVKCRCYSYINFPSQLCTQPPFSCYFSLPGEPPSDTAAKTAP